MSLFHNTDLTRFLEKTQSQKASAARRVVGLLIVSVLSALFIAALAAITINAPASILERVWYVVLIVLIVWYDIRFLRKFLRQTKRNER